MGVTVMEMVRRWQDMVAQETATVGAVELTMDKLVDVNREQMLAGRDANGDEIQPSYKYYQYDSNQTYADYKNKKNPKAGYGIPDLYDTGSFYKSISFYIEGVQMKWNATDEKTPDLLKKYGSVLGVYENEALKAYRQNTLLPLVIQIIKAATGAK